MTLDDKNIFYHFMQFLFLSAKSKQPLHTLLHDTVKIKITQVLSVTNLSSNLQFLEFIAKSTNSNI